MLSNRYLSSKDAFFVEDVLADINEFQDKKDTYRVLIFPPLSSYQRLLIHKTVETDFPDLITFSIGLHDARRTVVAFREACKRGEKGRELLSRPPEPNSDSQKTSKWNNLSSSDRVNNWVKQREARRLNRERWTNTTTDNSDGIDGFSSVNEEINSKSETCLQVMDRSKSKKNAAVGIYVPPSLRQKKTEEMEVESVNQFVSERELSSETAIGKCDDSSDVTSPIKRKNETEILQGKKDISTPDEKTRKGLGRGRGRRKPEMEVYVPRALREAKQDLKSKVQVDKPDKRIQEKKGVSNEKNEEGFSPKDKVSNSSIITETGANLNEIQKRCEPLSCVSFPQAESVNVNPPVNLPNCSYSDDVHNEVQQSPDSPGMNVLEPLVIDPVGTNVSNEGDSNVDPLTFEFYDPAVIAFMPSPKATEGSDFSFSSQEGVASTKQNYESCRADDDDNTACPIQDSTPMSYTQGDEMTYNSSNNSSLHVENEGGQVPQTFIEDSASNSSPGLDCHKEESNTQSAHCGQTYKEDDLSNTQSAHCGQTYKEDNQSKKKDKTCKSMNYLPDVKSTKMENDVKDEQRDPDDDGDEEDSWDALFDDNGDCLDDSLVEELTEHVGKVEIDKPKINYLNYTPKEPDLDMRAFSHIVEIYDFPSDLATHDLITAFRDFSSRGFDIKWVDDTHALGVFSSTVAANEALKMKHLMFKVRSMSEASKKGQSKAKHSSEFLQPYKARPETTSMAARRLVAGALGMTAQVPKEVRDQERKKLKEAKEKRRRDKQQKVDIWDGSVGKCAMDGDNSDNR